MKYDCTKAKDFFHEITRLNKWCRDKSCGTCEISTCPLGCAPTVYDWGSLSDDVFTNLIGVLQKWSDNHPERRELTENERDILKAFKALGYTYIATDSIGYVCVYVNKPQKGERAWFARPGDSGTTAVCETKKFFGGIVSWEDEEPAKIEDLLKEVEQK